MFGFHKLLVKDTPKEKLEQYKVRYSLANMCFEQAKSSDVGNTALFNAITHLQQVPECNVNMTLFDHLQFAMTDITDKEAYEYVESQLEFLHKLIVKMEMEAISNG